MWTYTQSSGQVAHDGTVIGTAYSGHGNGLDNPQMEAVPNVGPIPCGMWEIVQWHDFYENKGPVVAQLSPVGHDAHGRSGFLIHGDNVAMNETASDGCIVASRPIREDIRASGETQVEVVGGPNNEPVS